ncbi:MAG TPA: hypothetical protein VK828_09005 [Terriglobales bacterium]|jgi:hypothetical protein|nr:hypothetical protein [Terriglobales bacterium]
MPSHANRLAIALLTLAVLLECACGRPPTENASSSDSQSLPFDRQPHSSGISPSQTLVPSGTKLPEGTPIPIRLQSAMSSATSRAGDSFYGSVDEAVEVDGQTVIARDTPVTGRVLEAKAAVGPRDRATESSNESAIEPGYLRIVLVSLRVGRKSVAIETSSIFARGGSRDERKTATGGAYGGRPTDDKDKNDKNRDAVFGLDRRLNFRLAQAADLQ